ncbi:hypothetical protein LAZ67_X003563 [Cordylochernes scorpioides]|uniref:Uncharacterized protein n=1 Tax=Cordylochernes scorpioides TaxID=51811 RepID=A0ABY6LWC6_9ARAC|nr:hypothetical protein LAZ67_X003563 [Cordylochernes scorpioides]
MSHYTSVCKFRQKRTCIPYQAEVFEVQILTLPKFEHRVLVPKISLAPSDANLPFILKKRQFPLRLAFALTINKA